MAEKTRKSSAKKPRLLLASAIAIVLIAAVFAVALPATGFFTFLVPPEKYQAPPEVKHYGDIEKALKENGPLRPTTRPDYLPAEVYENLPPFPEDFYLLDAIITNQEGIVDLESLEEKYWKQPEFYPGWEEKGVALTANPDPQRDTIWGWGAYPADEGFATYPGAEFNAATFFHSSFTVQTFQGMKLIHVFPASADFKGKIVNSHDAERYFTVTIDPDLILLERTFPRFDKDWTHKIVIHVKVAETTPPGEYLIGVNPTAPPLEAKREWNLQHKLLYVDAGATGIQRPYFQMVVEVLPPEK